MPSEHIKEIKPNPDVNMAFTTSATPDTLTTLLPARARGGFRLNTPEATDTIFVYYVDYPGGDTTPFHIISPGGVATWDNMISRDGIARGYMGEVQVASPSASQKISVVEYLP